MDAWHDLVLKLCGLRIETVLGSSVRARISEEPHLQGQKRIWYWKAEILYFLCYGTLMLWLDQDSYTHCPLPARQGGASEAKGRWEGGRTISANINPNPMFDVSSTSITDEELLHQDQIKPVPMISPVIKLSFIERMRPQFVQFRSRRRAFERCSRVRNYLTYILEARRSSFRDVCLGRSNFHRQLFLGTVARQTRMYYVRSPS